MKNSCHRLLGPAVLAACTALSCGGDDATRWECLITEAPNAAAEVGCEADFIVLASQPIDTSISGARSIKTVIDQIDGDALYFQNSNRYQTHFEFVSANLSGNGKPIVPMLSDFNTTEYYSPSRRFLLGALTHYEGPGVYTYEISPYDTASAEMIEKAYYAIRDHSFIGKTLLFHPTSESVSLEAARLPASVPVITTEELFAGVDYQALNPAESIGQLRFITADNLATDYLTFRDIAVLDRVPNDIAVVMGIITAEFQTPLSHVNVLSKNRGTPNMALRDAFNRQELRDLAGKWVRLSVSGFGYSVVEVTKEEADSWWEEHKPGEVQVPGMNLDVTDLRNIVEVIDLEAEALRDAVKTGTRAFGGKASHYSALARIEALTVPKAFAVPLHYYMHFMEQNGFDRRVVEMIADPEFQSDPAVRDARLQTLRDAMTVAPVDPAFEQLLNDKLIADYPGIRMRFRSSTNAEDLDGFTGAGLYTSKTGALDDPANPVLDAVREVWASVWNFRAFEERSYRSIDHSAVGMALLVHRSFPDEEANGVALTNNPFDQSGLEPAFYVNVQVGDVSVVQPDAGVTTDQFIYYYDMPGQPVVFVAHSSLTPSGQNVLTAAQTYQLGVALTAIRSYFTGAYGSAQWWAMDVEFKFDGEPGEEPILHIKQARPYGP